MKTDKRGLSTIVVTLIIILLSLVSIGIVWIVVNNILKSGTHGIEVSAKCLNVVVEATAVNCSTRGTSRICDVQLMRSGTETSSIGGVKLVFRNSTSGTNSGLIDVAGNIEPLVGKRQTGIDTTLNSTNKVEVTAFFKDASENEQICSQTYPFSFH